MRRRAKRVLRPFSNMIHSRRNNPSRSRRKSRDPLLSTAPRFPPTRNPRRGRETAAADTDEGTNEGISGRRTCSVRSYRHRTFGDVVFLPPNVMGLLKRQEAKVGWLSASLHRTTAAPAVTAATTTSQETRPRGERGRETAAVGRKGFAERQWCHDLHSLVNSVWGALACVLRNQTPTRSRKIDESRALAGLLLGMCWYFSSLFSGCNPPSVHREQPRSCELEFSSMCYTQQTSARRHACSFQGMTSWRRTILVHVGAS